MELNICLAPPASWGLGHLLSGDLWPTYCGVTSSSNATCCVRYIWQEIRLYCTCWMEETCSSILIRLNSAKCMAILSLPHWFCVQMSTEHWAWDVPFSKALQMWWLIQPRSSWEITCEENSWPMRNSWWERERERTSTDSLIIPHPTQLFQGAAVPRGLPRNVLSYGFPGSFEPPYCAMLFLLSLLLCLIFWFLSLLQPLITLFLTERH